MTRDICKTTTALVLPVIHHKDGPITIEQAGIAFDAEADGVFLISHGGKDHELVALAQTIKATHPGKLVGINYLSRSVMRAAQDAYEAALDMVWGDNCGVNSEGLDPDGWWLSRFANDHPGLMIFASVAFKYQIQERDPVGAARAARSSGFMPTTSGDATGVAPLENKIVRMSGATDRRLAVASGMTCENVRKYARHLSHILVATGVSNADGLFDYETLCRFVSIVRTQYHV